MHIVPPCPDAPGEGPCDGASVVSLPFHPELDSPISLWPTDRFSFEHRAITRRPELRLILGGLTEGDRR